jgi:anti-sigma factor RsiW
MFFFFFFHNELAEALKTDKGFMDLLRRDAKARKRNSEALTKVSDESSHPNTDTLHDYVLGSLGREDTREVMEHLSVCEECADRALEIRRLEKEMTKDFRHWMRTSVSEPKDSSSHDPM